MVSFKPNQIIDTFVAKDGKKVVLRTSSWKDLNQLLHFINSLVEEDTFILMNKRKTLREEKVWLKEKIKRMGTGEGVSIVAEINRKIVGHCEIKPSTERSPHVGEIGMAILKEYRDIGIGKRMLQELIKIGKKMKFKFLFLGVFEVNKVGLKLYEKFGFKEVARLPKFFMYKGRYIDDILMMRKL